MLPALLVSFFHLRFQKTSELAVNRPTKSVALLYSTLDDKLIARQAVDVEPNALI